MNYSNAVANRVPFTFIYHESVPQHHDTSTIITEWACISGPREALNDITIAQDLFTHSASASLAESCSGELNEYVVTSVENDVIHYKHELPYHERANRTKTGMMDMKGQAKQLELRVDALLKQIEADRTRSAAERLAERVIFSNCEVLSRTLEVEMWSKVIRADKKRLKTIGITDFYQLERMKAKQNVVAVRVYSKTVPEYICLYEDILDKKQSLQVIRSPLAHPIVPYLDFLSYIDQNFTVPPSVQPVINSIARDVRRRY